DDYQHAVTTCLPGWARVMVCGSVTGDPYRFVQLWRVPSPFAPADAAFALRARGGPAYHGFFAELREMEQHVLAPLPYDPALSGRRRGGAAPRTAVVLVDEVAVARGALARLACLKQRFFIPRVEAMGWQLLCAASALTGRPGTVVHCWQLRESNALL